MKKFSEQLKQYSSRKFRNELADEFQVALSTINRWIEGMSEPSVKIQSLVIEFLKSKE